MGNTSRMKGDLHVRICERPRVKFPRPTRQTTCQRRRRSVTSVLTRDAHEILTFPLLPPAMSPGSCRAFPDQRKGSARIPAERRPRPIQPVDPRSPLGAAALRVRSGGGPVRSLPPRSDRRGHQGRHDRPNTGARPCLVPPGCPLQRICAAQVQPSARSVRGGASNPPTPCRPPVFGQPWLPRQDVL